MGKQHYEYPSHSKSFNQDEYKIIKPWESTPEKKKNRIHKFCCSCSNFFSPFKHCNNQVALFPAFFSHALFVLPSFSCLHTHSTEVTGLIVHSIHKCLRLRRHQQILWQLHSCILQEQRKGGKAAVPASP